MRLQQHLSCKACRPLWQEFRRLVDEVEDITPERRRWLITEYLARVHAADHDEASVWAALKVEHEASERAAQTIRRAVALRVAMMGPDLLSPDDFPAEVSA